MIPDEMLPINMGGRLAPGTESIAERSLKWQQLKDRKHSMAAQRKAENEAADTNLTFKP